MDKKRTGSAMKTISTESLANTIDDPTYQVIDVRPVEAYNGWKLKNEPRGGHIKNARSVPYKWSQYIDWIEIIRAKGITPQHSLIIYGYDPSETEQVAHQFLQAGYTDVHVYHNFTDEWSVSSQLPMQRLKRYRHLVSAEWLHGLIRSGEAPEFQNNKYVICHAHYQKRKDYEEGHIPSAIDLDTNWLESSKTWNCRSPQQLQKVFEGLGITYDTTVILYGRFSFPDNTDPFPGSSAGHLAAMRCAAIMLYAGVKDIRILNGGMQAWLDAGYDITTKDYHPHPVKNFGTNIPAHPEIIIDIKEAKNMLNHSNKNLVSVRSWKEYIGEVSGYNYILKKGRIPGSVFGNCGSDAYHMENYRNLDHTTREYHEIEHMWAEVGISPKKHNAFYCGTGWRGSEAFINAWLMGWTNISIFDGGWFEWINKGNDYETGIPKSH